MKTLALMAVTAALAACSQAAPEADAASDGAEHSNSSAGTGDDTGAGGPGIYEVTYANGTTARMTSAEDGTFSSVTGNMTVTGTVTSVDGKACFDADANDEGAICWTAGETAADGSWIATSDSGETVTVRPVT